MEVSTDPGFIGTATTTIALTNNDYGTSWPTSQGTTYYWRVRAKKTSPLSYSAWTSTWSFTAVITSTIVQHTITVNPVPTNGAITATGMVGNVLTVNDGATPTVTITPDLGYKINSITLNGSTAITVNPYGQSQAYVFGAVTSAQTITADFVSTATHTITFEPTGSGTITATGAVGNVLLVNEGATPTVTITPTLPGNQISSINLVGTGAITVTNPTGQNYTFFAVTSAQTIQATFVSTPTHTITFVPTGSGTITATGAIGNILIVDENATPTVTITPDAGNIISSITLNGSTAITVTNQAGQNYTFFAVTSAQTIAATFIPITKTITVSPVPTNGTITSTGIVGTVLTVNWGSTPSFTITPSPSYLISSITLNGSTPVTVTALPGQVQVYTFAPVTSNQTITAAFAFYGNRYVDLAGTDASTYGGVPGTGAYKTIQYAISQTPTNGIIHVGAGTFAEDLVITTPGVEFVGISATSTKIKGVSTGASTQYPSVDSGAGEPNINIKADNIVFHNFTIESPDVPDGRYSSGIVFHGKNIQFYNNVFHSKISSGQIVTQGYGYSVVMQSWSSELPATSTADISGLNIHNNSFTSTAAGTGVPSYEGIWLNRHVGTGNITIANNTFSGNLYRAIATETPNTTINGNTITSNLASNSSTTGIWIVEKTNITITQNNISGFAAGSGLKLGRTPLTGFLAVPLDKLNNVSVTKNTIKNNLIGVNIRADLSSYVNGDEPIVINNNSIFDNTQSGLEVTDGIGAGPGNYEFLDATNNWWGHINGPQDVNWYGTAANTGISAELPAGSASPISQWVNKAPSGNLGNPVVDKVSGSNLYIKYYPWNTGTPYLYYTDQNTVAGATFTMPVYASVNGNSFTSLQGKFTYDPAKLTYQSASYGLGTLINGAGWIMIFNASTPGVISFVGVGFNPISSDGLLLNLTFTVANGAGGVATITGNNADFKADGGNQIFGASGSFVGTVTYTFINATYKRGDVNLDGTVTLADASLLHNKITTITRSSLSDLAKQNSDADLSSGNPSVSVPDTTHLTATDVSWIMNYVLNGGIWLAPPIANLNSSTVEFVNTSINQNQLLSLPIAVNNVVGVQTFEMTLNYDPQVLNYQSFAQLKLNNGDLLDAQKVSEGVVRFVYVAKTASTENIQPGAIILHLTNGIPSSGKITSVYSINGTAEKAGPSYTFGAVTSVDEEQIIPKEFAVNQNYPNPFNPSTVIKYALPNSEFVTIRIYNILGQEVKTLVNTQKNAGTYRVQWNGDNNFGNKVSSGTYIYRIVAGNNVAVKKMVLLK